MPAKKKTEEGSGKDSKDVLESLLKETEKDHFAFEEPQQRVISSSSLALDSICKIYSGMIVRLNAKGAELGKTSQAFVFAQNYMDTMPKSKTIYIKCESRLSPEMMARTGHKFVTKSDEWDFGTVFIYPGNVFETIAYTLETLLKQMHENGEHLCIIWDALDGAILRGDLNKDMWGSSDTASQRVAGVPLLTKLLFKRMALPLDYYSGLMLVLSQYTTEIKLDPYSKEPPRQNQGSGGNSLNHMASYAFTYHPRYGGDLILEDPNQKPDPQKNKTLGVYATIEITKSASDVTGTKLKIPIARGRVGGCAIWQEKEIVDYALAWEVLTRAGAWYKFSPELIASAAEEGVTIKETHQGISGVYSYVEKDRAAFEWLYAKFKSLIS